MTTLLLAVEVYGAYFFTVVLATLFCFATWDFIRDRDACRRMRQLQAREDAYHRAEREAMELDYLYMLPAREPRRSA